MSVSELFDSTFCLHLTLTLAHFLWQGCAIAAAAAAACWCLRRASSQRRYLVHTTAMLLMVFCLPVTFVIVRSTVRVPGTVSLANVPDDFSATEATNQEEAAESAVPARPASSESSTARLESLIDPEQGGAESGIAVLDERPGAAAVESERQSAVNSISSSFLSAAAPYATSVYFVGMLGMLVRLWLALRGGCGLRRRSQRINDPSLLAVLKEQARRLGLRIEPALAYCEQVTVPVVIGVLRPMILLPVSLATGLTPGQLQAIITHELAHLRRHDHLVLIVQRVVEAVLFFHPAVWYVSWRIGVEREHCCDDAVVATGHERSAYAESLIRVAELSLQLQTSGRSIGCVALSVADSRGSQLRERILRLMGVRPREDFRLTRIWPVAMLLVFSIATALVATSLLHVSAESGQHEEGQPAAVEEDAALDQAYGAQVSFQLAETRRMGAVLCLAFSPDEGILAVGPSPVTAEDVQLVDIHTGEVIQSLPGHKGVRTFAFSQDGRMIATGDGSPAIRLWDLETGQVVWMRNFPGGREGHKDWVHALAFSPDGKLLASGNENSGVRLWETATGNLQQAFRGSAGVASLDFSSDGKILATGSADETVNLWDVRTGKVRMTLEGHGSVVGAVAFSPDDSLLASASHDRTVRLWDVSTGGLKHELTGHDNWVAAVEFSPDGKTLASGSWDQTIRRWDSGTGRLIQTLKAPGSSVRSLAFSPTGNVLVSGGSDDRTVKFWTPDGMPIAALSPDVSAGQANRPRFEESSLFINNHRLGPTNGARGTLKKQGKMTCGHPGGISEVTWEFVRSEAEGDVYRMTRTFPIDSDNRDTTTKTVTYRGGRLIVFEDDVQRISIEPIIISPAVVEPRMWTAWTNDINGLQFRFRTLTDSPNRDDWLPIEIEIRNVSDQELYVLDPSKISGAETTVRYRAAGIRDGKPLDMDIFPLDPDSEVEQYVLLAPGRTLSARSKVLFQLLEDRAELHLYIPAGWAGVGYVESVSWKEEDFKRIDAKAWQSGPGPSIGAVWVAQPNEIGDSETESENLHTDAAKGSQLQELGLTAAQEEKLRAWFDDRADQDLMQAAEVAKFLRTILSEEQLPHLDKMMRDLTWPKGRNDDVMPADDPEKAGVSRPAFPAKAVAAHMPPSTLWSKTDGGLSGRLVVAKSRVTTTQHFDLSLELRNINRGGGPGLAVQEGNPFWFEISVTDASGDKVRPTLSRVDILLPSPLPWKVLRPLPDERLSIPASLRGMNREEDSHLDTTMQIWRLPPGKYKIGGTFTPPKINHPYKGEATPWVGKLELPPIEVEVIAADSERDAATAAADVSDRLTKDLELTPEQEAKVRAWFAAREEQEMLGPDALATFLRTILDERQRAVLDRRIEPSVANPAVVNSHTWTAWTANANDLQFRFRSLAASPDKEHWLPVEFEIRNVGKKELYVLDPSKIGGGETTVRYQRTALLGGKPMEMGVLPLDPSSQPHQYVLIQPGKSITAKSKVECQLPKGRVELRLHVPAGWAGKGYGESVCWKEEDFQRIDAKAWRSAPGQSIGSVWVTEPNETGYNMTPPPVSPREKKRRRLEALVRKELPDALTRILPGNWKLKSHVSGSSQPFHYEEGDGYTLRLQHKGYEDDDNPIGGLIHVHILEVGFSAIKNDAYASSPLPPAIEIDPWHGRRVFLSGGGGDDWPEWLNDIKAVLKKTSNSESVKVNEEEDARGPATSKNEAAPDSAWGEPVQGVQVRLRTDKGVWKSDDVPIVKIDLKNNGKEEFYLIGYATTHCYAHIDDVTYFGSCGYVQALPGKSVTGVPITLSGAIENGGTFQRLPVTTNTDKGRLELKPGKHTVRVSFRMAPRGAPAGTPYVEVFSNPVQIEIVSTNEAPSSTQHRSDETEWEAFVHAARQKMAQAPIGGCISPDDLAKPGAVGDDLVFSSRGTEQYGDVKFDRLSYVVRGKLLKIFGDDELIVQMRIFDSVGQARSYALKEAFAGAAPADYLLASAKQHFAKGGAPGEFCFHPGLFVRSNVVVRHGSSKESALKGSQEVDGRLITAAQRAAPPSTQPVKDPSGLRKGMTRTLVYEYLGEPTMSIGSGHTRVAYARKDLPEGTPRWLILTFDQRVGESGYYTAKLLSWKFAPGEIVTPFEKSRDKRNAFLGRYRAGYRHGLLGETAVIPDLAGTPAEVKAAASKGFYTGLYHGLLELASVEQGKPINGSVASSIAKAEVRARDVELSQRLEELGSPRRVAASGDSAWLVTFYRLEPGENPSYMGLPPDTLESRAHPVVVADDGTWVISDPKEVAKYHPVPQPD